MNVAPLVGAWIEISWMHHLTYVEMVAPLVGAWIEISVSMSMSQPYEVAPLVGAWIEIENFTQLKCSARSLLSWERGLKFGLEELNSSLYCRSSRGSVD